MSEELTIQLATLGAVSILTLVAFFIWRPKK